MIQCLFHKLWKVQCLSKDFYISWRGVTFIITGRLISCFDWLGLILLHHSVYVLSLLFKHSSWISSQHVLLTNSFLWGIGDLGRWKKLYHNKATKSTFIWCVHVVKNGLDILKLGFQLPIMIHGHDSHLASPSILLSFIHLSHITIDYHCWQMAFSL